MRRMVMAARKHGPARSEKHVASMIMKDMKNLIDEDDYVDDTQKHTLYNLVRGEKSNLLVTNSVGAAEYRPKRPRFTILMVTKPLGGSDYVPKRGESESSSDSSDSTSNSKGRKNIKI